MCYVSFKKLMYRFASIFIIIAAILWGVDGIVLRPSLFSLPVSLVVFIESGIVAVYLSPILIKNSDSLKILKWKDWLAFAGVALFGGAIGTMAITKALFYVNFVNLSIVILIQKLQPVFALILAAIILKERLSKRFFIWAFLAIFGAYFMTFGMHTPEFDTGDKTLIAALFSLLAAFSFALSTILSKRALQNISFEMGTYLRFFITTIIMLIIVLGSGNLTEVGSISSKQIIVFLIIAFTTGGPAIFLYYYGLKRTTASVSTIAELAFPLTAVILEYLIRKNILGLVQWVGVIILVFSIYKVTRLNMNKKLKKLNNEV